MENKKRIFEIIVADLKFSKILEWSLLKMGWNVAGRDLSQTNGPLYNFLLPGKTATSTYISNSFFKKHTKTCNKPRDG